MPSSRRSASAHASSEVSRRWCARGVRRSISRPFFSASSRIQPDLLRDGGRRLAPRQVDVGVLGRDLAGGGRGAAEVDLGDRVGQLLELRALDAQVLAGEGHLLARPEPAHDREELAAALVAAVLVEEVAVGALLVGLAAGDDVEQEAAAGEVLEGRGHLGGQRRRGEAGPERDEELEPLRERGEHRRGEPRVLAPRAGRGQRGLEAELLGAAGDLPEVGHARGPAGVAVLDAVAAADDLAAVAAVGGQEPVELQWLSHGRECGVELSELSVVGRRGAVDDVAAEVLDLPRRRVVQGVGARVAPVPVEVERVEGRAGAGRPRRAGWRRRPRPWSTDARTRGDGEAGAPRPSPRSGRRRRRRRPGRPRRSSASAARTATSIWPSAWTTSGSSAAPVDPGVGVGPATRCARTSAASRRAARAMPDVDARRAGAGRTRRRSAGPRRSGGNGVIRSSATSTSTSSHRAAGGGALAHAVPVVDDRDAGRVALDPGDVQRAGPTSQVSGASTGIQSAKSAPVL